jgi:hypothetical protein
MSLISPFCGVNPSQYCIGNILGERKTQEYETCKSVKQLKSAKLEDIEDPLVSQIGQVNAKME